MIIACPNLTNQSDREKFDELQNAAGKTGAYYIWSANNGGIDLAPSGGQSVLLNALLDETGDRNSAVRLKCKTYTKGFGSWFGKWEDPETPKNEISKCTYENGEPKVVYHKSDSDFNEFDASNSKKDSLKIKPGFHFGTKKAAENIELEYGHDRTLYAVYLNLRNPLMLTNEEQQTYIALINTFLKKGFVSREQFDDLRSLSESSSEVRHEAVRRVLNSHGYDGYIYENSEDDPGSVSYVVFDSNQIKRITSNGFDSSKRIDRNIANAAKNKPIKLSSANQISVFGNSLDKLNAGVAVNSSDVIKHMLDSGIISDNNIVLAEMLSIHNIPIRFDDKLESEEIAATVTDEDGNVAILVNPNQIYGTQMYVANTILHEVIHAVTTSAMLNPKTESDRRFTTLNKKVFDRLSKLLPPEKLSRSDTEFGGYALSNVYEFAAVFLTDSNARSTFYSTLNKYDKSFVGTIKRFIKSIFNVLVGKSVFKTERQKLEYYESEFRKYLQNTEPIIKIKGDKYTFMGEVYNMTDSNDIALDQYHQYLKDLGNTINGLHVDYMLRTDPSVTSSTSTLSPEKNIYDTFARVANALTKRMAAIKASRLPEDYKTQHTQVLEAQIQQFGSRDMNPFYVVADFIQQLVPQLEADVKAVKTVKNSDVATINNSVYMYQRHDNFGVYKQILSMLSDLLDDIQVEQIMLENIEDSKNVNKNLLELRKTIEDATIVADCGDRIMKVLLVRNVEKALRDIGQEVHSPSMGEYLSMLKQIGYDTSSWFKYLGSADRAKDDGLRALAYLVNKAIQTADRKTHKKSVELLMLQDKLAPGERQLDLYELDDKGRTTGYLVRKYNYGQFFNDYNEFLSKLNEKYGLPANNRVSPESEEIVTRGEEKVTVRQAWNLDRNDWLNDHCHRKFKKSYYDAFAKLSNATQERRRLIQSKIAAIRQNALGDDGYYHYEKLTQKEWDTLRGLYIERRIDASDYTVTGQLKRPGDIQYTIAKELQELNEVLYDGEDAPLDTEAWAKARNAVKLRQKKEVKDLTEQISELKSNYTKDGKFDINLMSHEDRNKYTKLTRRLSAAKGILKEWDKRNSKVRLKMNKDTKKALLFEAIDKEAGVTSDQIIYEKDGDGGKRYKENEERIKAILRSYRDNSDFGKVDLSHLSIAARAEVEKLERENAEIRSAAKENDDNVAVLSAARGEAFNKYAVSEPTEQFELFRELWYRDRKTDDDMDYDDYEFDDMTGNLVGVDEIGDPIYRLFRMYTVVLPNDEYYEDFVEVTAGDGWIDTSKNNELLDTEFDESQGMTMVPKLEIKRYDNREQYNKIINSATLSALYNAVHRTIVESNDCFNNIHQYRDDYLLPQITGSLYKRMKGVGSKWRAIKDYVSEGTGFGGDLAFTQDTEFGLNGDTIFDKLDEFGAIIEGEYEVFGGKTRGMRPDGRRLNMLPQYFSRKLKDPGQISADLVGIVCEYYNQCNRYKNKDEIKDTCEAIVDMFEEREYMTKNLIGGKKITQGSESNTWQIGQKFLDMHLYNIQNANEYFGINFGKIAKLIRTATVAINLGCNIAVAVTGFLTATYSHIINAMVGQRYDGEDLSRAGIEVFEHLLRNGIGLNYIGDKMSNDKLMVLAEYFNISDQGKRKYKNTNRLRAVNALEENWCFGMLTGLDFIIKSNIMVSTLMSFKLLDGHFTTEEDIKLTNQHISKEDYDKLIDRWKNSKSVYEILSVKDGNLEIDPEYKDQFSEIEHVLHSRILKYAEAADGMATETQKAAITTNVLGAAVLTHRQYFPLLLQERFGHTIYDYDTQEYTGGIFRTGANAAKLAAFCLYDLATGKGLEESKVRWNDYFNNDETIEKSYLSQIRKYQLRQIIAENLAFFTLIFIPVSMLCAFADDDDKKDMLLLQLMAYLGRRTQWETYTPYRPIEMYNNIKSVTAQTSTTDKVEDVINSVLSYAMPAGSLFDTFRSGNIKEKNNRYVKRGVYKGFTKFERSIFKLFPQHNLYEQIYGSKAKRKYYENQIMKIEK